MQKTIYEFFELNLHTIANVLEVYKEKGIEVLKYYKQCPASASDEIRQLVIKSILSLKELVVIKAVEAKAAEGYFEKNICLSMMQKILKGYRDE